ncbi:MAG TPA: cell filamentation protein Fic [Sulfurimonas sp. UBA12504]|nr:MAG: cell filamentation protein Fic [Sulfurimonas sp. GWF2_37_8]DAB30593.1 MAG TPA: cell filamentation protein Fic [Sulfurimonas sp. UBA12504]
MKKQKWIWEYDEYPNFKYNKETLEPLLRDIAYEQGKLKSFMLLMDKESTKYSLAQTLENEIIASCEIEGEILNRQSVRSSIKQKLGLESQQHYKALKKEDNYVDILIDANTNYDEDLTLEKLFGWHHAMFEKGYSGFAKIKVAEFRGEGAMQVVSGDYDKEKIHYEAPPYDTLEREMDNFIKWFNETPTTLEIAAITHLWFVIIHPFDDGNGRITRALTDRVLSKLEHSSFSKIYTMSKSIYEDRKGYYEALDKTTGRFAKDEPLDITYWMVWFFKTLHDALLDAQEQLNYIVEKTKFWDEHREDELNSRQIKVLNRLLDIGSENFKGDLTKAKYIKITDTAETNASRDIADLLAKGCIKKVEDTIGRGTRYTINHK